MTGADSEGDYSPERYAVVDVIAPDGSNEDTVKVQFDYEQPLGIDPLAHSKEGRFPSDYSLELRYIVIDGTQYLADESRPVGGRDDGE